MTNKLRPPLVYFAICFAPLLLLVILNYLHEVSSIDANLAIESQNTINALSGEIDKRLREAEINLTRVATSASVQDYLAGSPNEQTLPADLDLNLRSIPSSPGHFLAVSLFGVGNRPLLQIERQENGPAGSTLIFRRTGFAAPSRGEDVAANQPVVSVGNGSILQYSVPVMTRDQVTQVGLLVGDLKLDEVVSDIAAFVETKPNDQVHSRMSIVVIDSTARILYHQDRNLRGKLASSAMPEFLPIAEAAVANASGTSHFEGNDGIDYFTAYAPLPRWHIYLAVAQVRSMLVSGPRQWALIGLLVSALIATGAAVVLNRHVQRRSRGIERVGEDLSAIVKGELDRRIELKSSDDARGIADKINVVTERLRAQIAREEESRQFESFIRLSAMLTHDLKNAIEALSLIVGNMERHFDNEQFRADALRSLTGATDKLKAIVARLSKPVTTLSGEHKVPTMVDLVPVFKRVIAMTAEPLREKHTIVLKLPVSLYALADESKIEEVVENLVINAIEAMADQPGKLTIEAGPTENGAAMFAVSDTGPGMSQTFIDTRLFRPFSTTKSKGVGLGLYTCREVVRAHAGTIEVQSEQGAGTTFRVVLPSTPLR